MPRQLPHDLQFSVNQIQIDPVAGANGAERPAIERFGNHVTDGDSIMGERRRGRR